MVNQSKEAGKERIVVLVDTYTFATQVLARAAGNPHWNQGPSVTALSTGRIISANSHAKKLGINNTIKLPAARRLSPDLQVFTQPTYDWGKPDQTLFREAGHEILEVIQAFARGWKYPPILHWVPQDETYLDITDQVNYLHQNGLKVRPVDESHVAIAMCAFVVRRSPLAEGPKWPLHKEQSPEKAKTFRPKSDGETKLQLGWKIVANLQKVIQRETTFHCSAGIGPNKMLAKIACGLNPPGSLTALTYSGISKYKNSMRVPLKKLSALSSSVKQELAQLGILTMGQVQMARTQTLINHFGREEAMHIRAVGRGRDHSPLEERTVSRAVNCGRNFGYKPIKDHLEFLSQVLYLRREMRVRLQEQAEWFRRQPSKLQLVINFVGCKTRTIPLDLDQFEEAYYIADVLTDNQVPVQHKVKALKLAALKFD